MGEAVALIRARLSALTYVERQFEVQRDNAWPAYSRWADATLDTLHAAGWRNEMERFERATMDSELGWRITHARDLLETLIEQIHHDPAALGLRHEQPQAPSTDAPPATARGQAPALIVALVIGALCGLFGRGFAVDAGRAIASWLAAAQVTLQAFATRAVGALTPGAPPALPTWVGATAFWLLVGVLVTWSGIQTNVLGAVAHQAGMRALRRYPVQLGIVVVVSAVIAVLLAR